MSRDSLILLAEADIQALCSKAACQLSEEYQNEQLHFLILLKGALFFAADLMRELSVPCTFSTMQCSSYTGTERDTVSIAYAEPFDVTEKTVVILDDILDTGHTLVAAQHYIEQEGAKAVKTMVLLEKRKQRDTIAHADYALHTINDEFVIGYGLDMHEYERNRKEIRIHGGS